MSIESDNFMLNFVVLLVEYVVKRWLYWQEAYIFAKMSWTRPIARFETSGRRKYSKKVMIVAFSIGYVGVPVREIGRYIGCC